MKETNVSLSPAPVTRPQEQKDKWPERGSGQGCSHTGRGEGGRGGPGGGRDEELSGVKLGEEGWMTVK